jgi:hypothetical protein
MVHTLSSNQYSWHLHAFGGFPGVLGHFTGDRPEHLLSTMVVTLIWSTVTAWCRCLIFNYFVAASGGDTRIGSRGFLLA